MTTWTMEQVQQARGVRARVILDPAVWSSRVPPRVDVMESVLKKMFRSMTEVAHPFGIELHQGDIRWRDDPDDSGVEITAWWEPRTNEVELRGGEQDGEILTFAGAPHGSIMVARQQTIDWSQPADRPVPTTRPLEYRCTGWSESDRRWVYELR